MQFRDSRFPTHRPYQPASADFFFRRPASTHRHAGVRRNHDCNRRGAGSVSNWAGTESPSTLASAGSWFRRPRRPLGWAVSRDWRVALGKLGIPQPGPPHCLAVCSRFLGISPRRPTAARWAGQEMDRRRDGINAVFAALGRHAPGPADPPLRRDAQSDGLDRSTNATRQGEGQSDRLMGERGDFPRDHEPPDPAPAETASGRVAKTAARERRVAQTKQPPAPQRQQGRLLNPPAGSSASGGGWMCRAGGLSLAEASPQDTH